MAKKLGKTEKTLLIAGGVAVGAYLLFKGMSGSNGGSSYNGGTTYIPNNNANNGGNSGGANITDTINTGLNIVKDGLDKIQFQESIPASQAQKVVDEAAFKAYKIAYDYMMQTGTTSYKYPNGKIITFDEAKSKLAEFSARYGWDY